MVAWLLIKQIAVLFIIMLTGILIVKYGLVKAEDSRVLSVLTIYLVMPCVIIHAFQIDYSEKIKNGFLLAFASAILIHVVLLLLSGIVGKVIKLNLIEKTSLIYSNSGNFIIPLVLAILGEEWLIYASAYMVVQLFFFWTHGQSLMQSEKNFQWKKILCNVNLVSIMIGITIFFRGITLPSIINNAMSSVSAMVGPLSMIMLGMLVAGSNCDGLLRRKRTWLILALKMLIFPGIILVILKYTGIANLTPEGRTILLISLLATTTPSATMAVQMAQIFQKDELYAVQINIMTTLVCIITMPILIYLYQM